MKNIRNELNEHYIEIVTHAGAAKMMLSKSNPDVAEIDF